MIESNIKLFRKLWKLVNFKNIKNKLIVYLILIFISLPLETIFLPYMVLSKLSNLNRGTISSNKLTYIIGLFVVTYSVIRIIDHVRFRLGSQLQIQIYIDSKETMMEEVMNTYKKSQKELPLGKIIQHMDNVPYLVEQIIYKAFCYLIPQVICLISIVFFLFYVDYRLGLIGLAFFILYFYSLAINIRKSQEMARLEAKHRAKHTQGILNTLDNILYILISDSFPFEKSNFKSSNDTHKKRFMECEKSNSGLFLKLDTLCIIFVAAISLCLFYLILSRPNKKLLTLYTSVFVILLFALDKLVDFKHNFTDIANSLFKSQVFLEEIKNLGNKEGSKIGKSKINIQRDKENSVEVHHLKYSYPKTNYDIFKTKSFTFKRNKLIAIQGESGSGKTTLGKIIMGLVNPDQGEIYINHLNLTDDFAKRQKLVGYIPQNVKLFESTILDNIRYTCSKTITKLYLDNWIMEKGVRHILMKNSQDINYLERNVGVAGSELSGGQKQIIIILRTFLANKCSKSKKTIFILDEPTSALDPKTANIIIELLKEFSKVYTIIIITHDKNVAEKCHQSLLI